MRVKSLVILVLSFLIISGCATLPDSGTADKMTKYEIAGDHAIGSPDADITIAVYFSPTCSHCANWHKTIFPRLRADYIDTGKVRFIYREFPTPPVRLAEAGLMIARCADEEKYFENIERQFEQWDSLVVSARNGKAKAAYTQLAQDSGLSKDEFNQCLANEEEYEAMEKAVKLGVEKGISAVPTLIINGEIAKVYTYDEIETYLSKL